MNLILGMDTGGTYTDGVIFDKDSGEILEKAKTLTTKNDYCICIGNCLDKLSEDMLKKVKVVCLSTTLATNAVVEGKDCKTELLIMGKMPCGRLPSAKTYMIKGKMDIQGRVIHDIDLDQIDFVSENLDPYTEAVVISGYASVRNPQHEISVRERIQSKINIPVVCAHEISGALGFYERTVTAVLNGKLVPILKRLIWDTKEMLRDRGISAPLMIVKGDGSFISADVAQNRPIDTLLSGPAASVKGAMFLSGIDNGVFADMGGTTIDIACLDNGKVKVSSDGASIAGWRTRVCAIDIYTKGLGGDSLIRMDKLGNIKFGPEKVTPICMTSQLKNGDLLVDTAGAGFTPTDMAHIKGIYDKWDREISVQYLKDLAYKMGIKAQVLYKKIEDAFYDSIYDALVESGKYKKGDIVIGIGAPAMPWMPFVAERKGIDIRIPEHAEVANAIGAATGNVEETTDVVIRKDSVTGKYIGYLQWKRLEFSDLDEAKRVCLEEARKWLERHVDECGCDVPDIISEIEDIWIDRYGCGEKIYAETKIKLVAAGAPSFIEK